MSVQKRHLGVSSLSDLAPRATGAPDRYELNHVVPMLRANFRSVARFENSTEILESRELYFAGSILHSISSIVSLRSFSLEVRKRRPRARVNAFSRRVRERVR